MNNIWKICVFSLLVIFSCQPKNEPAAFKITGKIQGLERGKVYLEKKSDGTTVIVDSTNIIKGAFTLKGHVDFPEMYQLRIDTLKLKQQVFVENGNICVTIDAENPDNVNIDGSQADSLFRQFKTLNRHFESIKEELMRQYNDAANYNNAKLFKQTDLRYDSLEHEWNEFIFDFVSQHRSSPVAPYLVYSRLIYNLDLENLKKTVAMFDSTMLKSVYLQKMISRIEILENVAVGKPAPDITQPALNGGKLSLSQYKGQVVLVDFWASWCGPCRRANPEVVRIFRKYNKKGFTVLGVSLDKNKDAWLKAIRDDKLAWDHVSQLNGWENQAARDWGVMSIPHSFLIGKDGIIVYDNPDPGKLEELLNTLLK